MSEFSYYFSYSFEEIYNLNLHKNSDEYTTARYIIRTKFLLTKFFNTANESTLETREEEMLDVSHCRPTYSQ